MAKPCFSTSFRLRDDGDRLFRSLKSDIDPIDLPVFARKGAITLEGQKL